MYQTFNGALLSEPAHTTLIAFSMFTNGKYIFTTNNPNQLHCLNGLKALGSVIMDTTLYLCVFGWHRTVGEYDKIGTTIYTVLLRPVWSFGISWIIYH